MLVHLSTQKDLITRAISAVKEIHHFNFSYSFYSVVLNTLISGERWIDHSIGKWITQHSHCSRQFHFSHLKLYFTSIHDYDNYILLTNSCMRVCSHSTDLLFCVCPCPEYLPGHLPYQPASVGCDQCPL